MEECNVCVESKKVESIIECGGCGYRVCKQCIITYILSSSREAHCMKCRTGWSQSFLAKNFSSRGDNKFLKTQYPAHRKQCMFEEEKMMLVKCMKLAKYMKRVEMCADKRNAYYNLSRGIIDDNFSIYEGECLQEDIDYITSKVNRNSRYFPCLYDFNEVKVEYGVNEFLGNVDTLLRNMDDGFYAEHRDQLAIVLNNAAQFAVRPRVVGQPTYRTLELSINSDNIIDEMGCWFEYLGNFYNKKIKEEYDIIIEGRIIPKERYTIPCPSNGCNALLEEGVWFCKVCGVGVCSNCLCAKTSTSAQAQANTHMCKEDDVRSAKLVLESTKPCPKCAARIHKIEGCSQVWCVLCHTAFDYHTGEIDNGTIHNPHYYEYLEKETMNRLVERRCNPNELPDASHLGNFLKRVDVQKYHRLAGQCENHRSKNNTKKILNLRAHFILGKVNEKNFKQQILLFRRKQEVETFYRTLKRTCYLLFAEEFHNLLAGVYNSDISNFYDRCNYIINFFNETSRTERKLMGYKVYLKIISSHDSCIFRNSKI